MFCHLSNIYKILAVGLGVLIASSCTDTQKAIQEPTSVENLDMEPPLTELENTSPPNEQQDPQDQQLDLDSNPVSEATENRNPSAQIPNENFGLTDEGPADPFVVTASILNIRNGNGVHYPVVGWLKQGQTVHVMQLQGDWAQIGAKKWVYKPHIKRIKRK